MTIFYPYLVAYLFSFFLFFNSNSLIMFWVSTELNLVLFICMMVSFMENTYKQEMHDMVLFYFFVQLLSSILFLIQFFFDLDLLGSDLHMIFILALTVKLGIFPSFYWVFQVSPFLGKVNIWLVLTLQKIPFFFILFSFFSTITSLILLFSFISGSVLVFFSNSLIMMIVSSSIMMTFWIFYLFSLSPLSFIIFFFFYSSIVFLFLDSLAGYVLYSSGFMNLYLFIFFIGLPPLSLFFFKLDIMSFFFHQFGLMESLIFWFFTVISLFGYMKFSYKYFFNFKMAYSWASLRLNNMFFYSFSLIFFLWYLSYQGKLFKLSSSYLE